MSTNKPITIVTTPALIEGLEALADLRISYELIEVRGDAKCVIDQMRGHASVRSPLTRAIHNRARKNSKRFKSLTWVWAPHRENKYADKLSRRSFRYLHYSPGLEREINNSLFIQLYRGRMFPLFTAKSAKNAKFKGFSLRSSRASPWRHFAVQSCHLYGREMSNRLSLVFRNNFNQEHQIDAIALWALL